MGRKKKAVNGDGAETNTGANEANMSDGSAASGGETMQGYFRRVFGEHPEWVKPRSNARVYQRWHDDHPGHTDVPASWRNALTNVKSDLRSRAKGKGKGRGSRGRPAAAAAEPRARSAGPKVPAKTLLELEEKIDDCLIMARRLGGGDALERIAEQLRKARNAVIKMGE